MVPNSISGIVSSVDWPENITDHFGKMSGQSLIREPIFFQIYTGSLEFGLQLIVFFLFRKSMRILFTDRALPTIRRMDKVSKNYGSLRGATRLLRCPDSALRWLNLNGWDDTEFAIRSSVEWHGIHQWGITCLIGIVIVMLLVSVKSKAVLQTDTLTSCLLSLLLSLVSHTHSYHSIYIYAS